MIVTLYASTIHDTICLGDLRKMKAVAKQAEKYLSQAGNIPAALESLKLEIAKLEGKKKR